MGLQHAMTNGRQRTIAPPGGVVDVLVASKDGKLPDGLENIPWEINVLMDRRAGWANAANNLLEHAAANGHDAIFVDDDVTILPETFAGFDKYYPLADVFGFRLRGQPGRDDQCGWGLQKPNPHPDRACYVAHVTASLMYVRSHVLTEGQVRFPVWPGSYFEDIVFTYECWYRNFAVAYVPLPALHDIVPGEDGAAAGATKRHEMDLQIKRDINHANLGRWCEKNDIKGAADAGRIPFGIWGIDP